ncbi:uncharacterized protein BJX67DRAFT_376810 [Aspergillus lucknowensis]|uniref:Fungal-specific transcription factor domain-containing protein n=1 Tax=Aspergillus lucknowensis TaxID=176173 RepID=A0ABR4M5U5_9EURO
MSPVILDFFKTYILTARVPPNNTHQPTPPNLRTQVPALEPGGRLFRLIQRVCTLHHKSRQESGLNTAAISQAVHIWHELDTWNADPDPDPNPDGDGRSPAAKEHALSIYQLYIHAIFLWTYLIIHPNDVHEWKAQDALRGILQGLSGVGEARELQVYVVVPLFLGGLAAVRPGDRDVVAREFERVREATRDAGVGEVYSVVRRCWGLYDAGVRSSWDWMKGDG